MSRGVDRQAIYRDDADRGRFLDLLAEVVEHERWSCLTYCLMDNHFHICVRLSEANLARGMQRLKGDYARYFNDRYSRGGALYERRYDSVTIVAEPHLLESLRYIPLNPVRAGICPNAEQWPWSAHRALLGSAPPGVVDIDATLSCFHPDAAVARVEYARFVVAADPAGNGLSDLRLKVALREGDPSSALLHAHDELGYGIAELADALACHPKTVQRRVRAARANKGV